MFLYLYLNHAKKPFVDLYRNNVEFCFYDNFNEGNTFVKAI